MPARLINPLRTLLRRLTRLFVIRSRVAAFAVIYALALGAAERGGAYVGRYPGPAGALLYFGCLAVVVMAGARILDAVRYERERATDRSDG